MYQKDFILRMIEMLGDLIAGILGLIRKGDFQQASQSIDNAYYNFLKEDAAYFRHIPREKLTEELIREHNYSNGHLEMLSELFFVEAELLYAKGNQDESIEFYEKVLILCEFVERESKLFSAAKQSRLSMIKSRINVLRDASLQ